MHNEIRRVEKFCEETFILLGTDDTKKIALFFEAAFIFKFEFTALVVRSSAYVLFILPHLF